MCTLHPSHSFLTELRTFMPRTCCVTAIGLGTVRASGVCDMGMGDRLHGVCTVLESILGVDVEVEKEVRKGCRRHCRHCDMVVARMEEIRNMFAIC